MATFVAILCVITVALCVPLIVWKPKWVFYIFIITAVFNSILAGYINQAGNLGLPLTWTPADFLSLMTLLAALFIHRQTQFRAGIIKKCIIVLAFLSVLSLMQGMILFPRDALTHSRVVHFTAAGLFALRYFTDYSRVKGFIKFSALLMLVMFAFHILIRVGIYDAPIAETGRIIEIGGLVGERGTRALIPMLYLILISLAVSRCANKIGFLSVSIILLLIGLGGVVLSETRSTYGAMLILIISALIFMRARIKNSIIFTFVALVIVYTVTIANFDFLARFRTDYGQGYYSIPSLHELRNNWRGIEYETIVTSYKQEPYFLLTGRGVGAMHPAPRGTDPLVAFYHSEYLGWLDRCGLIGLIMVIILILACLWRSFMLTRSDILYLRYLGTTSFLLIMALAADGIFHPVFSHYRGASLLICFAAITANWRDIYMSLTEETQVYPEEIESELAENYEPGHGLPQVAY